MIVKKEIVRYFTGQRDKMPEKRTDEEGDPGTWGNALGINDFWDPVEVEIQEWQDGRKKYWVGKYKKDRNKK